MKITKQECHHLRIVYQKLMDLGACRDSDYMKELRRIVNKGNVKQEQEFKNDIKKIILEVKSVIKESDERHELKIKELHGNIFELENKIKEILPDLN